MSNITGDASWDTYYAGPPSSSLNRQYPSAEWSPDTPDKDPEPESSIGTRRVEGKMVKLSPTLISATPIPRYGTDGESDSITTLMMKSTLGKNRKKKNIRRDVPSHMPGIKENTSSYRPETLPELEPAKLEDTASAPLSAIHVAITTNTGFSPLNPSAPLPEYLNPRKVAEVDEPKQNVPKMSGGISSSSNAPRVLNSPPPSIPPTPVIVRPSYREIRPKLFQDAFFGSINGTKFDDTEIHVFSARTRHGVAHKPNVLHARSAFLQAASVKFEEELYVNCALKSGATIPRMCSRLHYCYDGDSDLEEDEEEVGGEDAQQSAVTLHWQKMSSATKAVIGNAESEATTKRSPGGSDGDLLSLDGLESESGFSDLSQEARKDVERFEEKDEFHSGFCTPQLKPALTLQTSTPVLNAQRMSLPVDERLEDHHKQGAVDVRKQETRTVSVSKPSKGQTKQADCRVLMVSDGAYKTWQALLLYLYNDYLNFAPLSSEGCKPASPPSEGDSHPKCSPKSMYRLADKLELADLKQQAFRAIEQGLTEDNIVKELFSDFTWRYTEVLQMETEIFYCYSKQPAVQAAMSEIFQDIAYGQLPHSSVVLESLFKKFAAASR